MALHSGLGGGAGGVARQRWRREAALRQGRGKWGRGRSGSGGRTSVTEMFRRTQKRHLVSVPYEELERNLEPVM